MPSDPKPRPPRALAQQHGFSLVEILVALALLAIALTTITGLYLGHHRVQVRLGHRWAAQSFLVEQMEALATQGLLEEGERSWELGKDVPPPPGFPWEGAVLTRQVARWEGAKGDEETQHVILSLAWDWRGTRRTAQLETLLGGAAL